MLRLCILYVLKKKNRNIILYARQEKIGKDLEKLLGNFGKFSMYVDLFAVYIS